MPASFRQSVGASMIWSRSASWLLRTRFCERRYRLDEFTGGDDGIGVVRDVDVERGVHRFVRIIRSRVPDHRDVYLAIHRLTSIITLHVVRSYARALHTESHTTRTMDTPHHMGVMHRARWMEASVDTFV